MLTSNIHGTYILANEVRKKNKICDIETIAKYWTRTTYTIRNTSQSEVDKQHANIDLA